MHKKISSKMSIIPEKYVQFSMYASLKKLFFSGMSDQCLGMGGLYISLNIYCCFRT